MREIKFRVWNNNKMIRSAHLSEDFCFMVTKQGEFVDCVLMQYTGLKDKNGKEIYEGDIVHVTDFFHGDAKVYKGVVKFVGGYYRIEGQDIRNAPLGWIISSDDLEVIGNIYENPEYLERGGVR